MVNLVNGRSSIMLSLVMVFGINFVAFGNKEFPSCYVNFAEVFFAKLVEGGVSIINCPIKHRQDR